MYIEVGIAVVLMLTIGFLQAVYTMVGPVSFLAFVGLIALGMYLLMWRFKTTWEVAFLTCFVLTPEVVTLILLLRHD